VKIVDFGLAKANSQLEKSEPGIIKGKFSYLSPEAAMGQDVDARTDIFAVGIILWELLAGQRLFLGETDFQTVKKVQQAQVPAISTLNPKVTPDLERIINKALARDPAARYVTARDLARDLTTHLFKIGQAVSAFDVASLVIGAQKDRAKKKPQQGSIIDKLIEEALFEFTSLGETGQHQKVSADASQAQAPLNLGEFVNPKGWLDEMNLDMPKPGQSAALQAIPSNVTAGNLSALEEDDLAGKKIPVPAPVQRPLTPAPMPVMQRPPTPAGPISAPVSASAQLKVVPEKPRGMGALIGILVVVIAFAGFGVAWAMKIIPH
jgi:serine/threonine-protein kinase